MFTLEKGREALERSSAVTVIMGVDIGVWRARIGSFNASVRRSSSKRAKQPVCGAGKAELEVVVLAVLLLIMAGGVEYSQHQNSELCVFDVACLLLLSGRT